MIITVNQLNRYLTGMIDCEPILNGLTVEGELSDVRTSGGYLYFVLRDSESQIDGMSDRVLDFQDGDYVIIKGRVTFYPRRGRISFFAKEIIRADRFGAKHREFLELKEEFQKKGYFDAALKKTVCKYPKRIGVVTSSNGSVIRDIIKVVKRRYPIVDIVIFPSKVQGIDAAVELIDGINFFSSSEVDTVIIARGGGSSEDLSCFNDRRLVEAVHACVKPVISAVGHETDFTLCDFVADFRASTPSVAAEIATQDINALISNCIKNLKLALSNQKKLFSAKQGKAAVKIRKFVNNYEDFFNAERKCLINNLNVNAGMLKLRFKLARHLTIRKLSKFYCLEEDRLRRAEVLINQKTEPLILLKKGYVKLYGERGCITGTRDTFKGDVLNALFADGRISVEVIDIRNHKN